MNNFKCYMIASCLVTICCHSSMHTSHSNSIAAAATTTSQESPRELEQQPDYSPSGSVSAIVLPGAQQTNNSATAPDAQLKKVASAGWDDDDSLVTATEFTLEQQQQKVSVLSSSAAAAATGDLRAENLTGSSYQVPEVPAQTATSVTTIGIMESYQACLVRIINAGQFDAAHSRPKSQGAKLYPKINEHSGLALAEVTGALVTTLGEQGKALDAQRETQHKALQTSLYPAYLIAQAAKRECATGAINEERIKHELMVLKEAQRNAERQTDRMHQENQAREEVIRILRYQYAGLLQQPKDEDRISPSRRQKSPKRVQQQEAEQEG